MMGTLIQLRPDLAPAPLCDACRRTAVVYIGVHLDDSSWVDTWSPSCVEHLVTALDLAAPSSLLVRSAPAAPSEAGGVSPDPDSGGAAEGPGSPLPTPAHLEDPS